MASGDIYNIDYIQSMGDYTNTTNTQTIDINVDSIIVNNYLNWNSNGSNYNYLKIEILKSNGQKILVFYDKGGSYQGNLPINKLKLDAGDSLLFTMYEHGVPGCYGQMRFSLMKL